MLESTIMWYAIFYYDHLDGFEYLINDYERLILIRPQWGDQRPIESTMDQQQR